MKKMLAVSKKYLKDDGSPKESGKTREDVIKMILDDTYKLLKLSSPSSVDHPEETEANADDEAEKEQKTSSSPDIRPSGWFPAGWMAFLLWGPLVEKRQRMDLICNADHQGISNIRKEGLSQESVTRKNLLMNGHVKWPKSPAKTPAASSWAPSSSRRNS